MQTECPAPTQVNQMNPGAFNCEPVHLLVPQEFINPAPLGNYFLHLLQNLIQVDQATGVELYPDISITVLEPTKPLTNESLIKAGV